MIELFSLVYFFVEVLLLEYIKVALLSLVLFVEILFLECINAALALLVHCVVTGGLVRLVNRQNRPADSLSSRSS